MQKNDNHLSKKFTFIDLFAGIGGFHLAMHRLGGECVFASEIDTQARKTYKHNFHKINPHLFSDNLFNDDIRKISPSEIPDFDVLCAGFPCQPFSQAGYKRGFIDNHKSERGNLFFNIVEVIEEKKPKAFFLENVRGIINHDEGKTFQTIREILENELGYSFYHKVVKASDYGLPQHRPRTFMIGFRDDSVLGNFAFPKKIPLAFNMSDVWEGECSREIGYTLRVGGRGSDINDRRNWDAYLVDGKVKKLMPEQGKKMQGFPESFEFPVPYTQAMKQLGNSVAINAVQECGKELINYLDTLQKRNADMATERKKNKGEWTEIYSFLKIIHDKKLLLADKNLNTNPDSTVFNISKVSTLNIIQSVHIHSDGTFTINAAHKNEYKKNLAPDFITEETLKNIVASIKKGKSTFDIPEINVLQDKLGLSIVKGGNSNQKSDIVLDIHNETIQKQHEGFGIKSFLGSKPTLLNASSNTNFVFRVNGLDKSLIDEINAINTGTKLKDRLDKIQKKGGSLEFSHVEKETMQHNLEMVDSNLPSTLSKMLLEFYINRTNKISENIQKLTSENQTQLQAKIKRLLVSVLLGFFAGTKWDGKYVANGAIVVKEDGEQVGLHIIEMSNLEDYLFENIKFDTPSTTRHRYGSLYLESDGKLYFKLNLQLRF